MVDSKKLAEGLRHTEEKTVEQTDLDSYWGIGTLNVIATPVLIGFVEQTIIYLITPFLSEYQDAFCAEINLKHIKPASFRETLHCSVHLKFIDSSKLFIDVVVLNEKLEEIMLGAEEWVIIVKS